MNVCASSVCIWMMNAILIRLLLTKYSLKLFYYELHIINVMSRAAFFFFHSAYSSSECCSETVHWISKTLLTLPTYLFSMSGCMWICHFDSISHLSLTRYYSCAPISLAFAISMVISKIIMKRPFFSSSFAVLCSFQSKQPTIAQHFVGYLL